jgi:hypothetical protein
MRYVFGIALFLITSTASFAQGIAKVDTDSYVPTVVASDDSFAIMCQNFVKKVGGKNPSSGIITFKPKVMTPSEYRNSGSVWVLNSIGNNKVEVSNTELPLVLRRLTGELARNILQMSCYTENMFFFGQRDVLIITAEDKDAIAVANALNR